MALILRMRRAPSAPAIAARIATQRGPRSPAYTFALDKQAGQTTGEGSSNFGAKWYAVSARGTAVKAATTTTTTTGGTTTTTPYPYP